MKTPYEWEKEKYLRALEEMIDYAEAGMHEWDYLGRTDLDRDVEELIKFFKVEIKEARQP